MLVSKEVYYSFELHSLNFTVLEFSELLRASGEIFLLQGLRYKLHEFSIS